MAAFIPGISSAFVRCNVCTCVATSIIYLVVGSGRLRKEVFQGNALGVKFPGSALYIRASDKNVISDLYRIFGW